MILIVHIISALASLVFTGASLIKPTNTKLKSSIALVVATLISGTFLVLRKPANITQVCVEGLVYLAVVGLGIVVAKNKLAKEHAKHSLV